jgi:hypothetical protein
VAAIPSIEQIAEVLALAHHSTPWFYEGPVRHRLRVILLEARWTRSWHRADMEARRLVANGRLKNGVRVPRGWDSPNDLSSWTARNECEICDRWFTPNSPNQLYCSARCGWRAKRIRALRVQLRHCGYCRETFETGTSLKKFCSSHCRREAEKARMRAATLDVKEDLARRCRECDAPIPVETQSTAKYCSTACNLASWKREHAANVRAHRDTYNEKRREQRRLATLNGNGHAHATNGSAAEHRSNGTGDPIGHHEDHAGAQAGPPGAADLDEQRMLA